MLLKPGKTVPMLRTDSRDQLGIHADALPQITHNTWFLWLLYNVWCHWKLGETGEMEALARRSIALYPNIPWNWLGLAAALALQGRLDEAREAMEPVKAMMPSYTPSRFHWGARYVYGSRFRDHVESDYRALRNALNACLKPQDRDRSS